MHFAELQEKQKIYRFLETIYKKTIVLFRQERQKTIANEHDDYYNKEGLYGEDLSENQEI